MRLWPTLDLAFRYPTLAHCYALGQKARWFSSRDRSLDCSLIKASGLCLLRYTLCSYYIYNRRGILQRNNRDWVLIDFVTQFKRSIGANLRETAKGLATCQMAR